MKIRFKLTMTGIAVIFVANALLSFVTVEYAGRIWLDEVQTRVKLDLNSARAAYENHIDVIAAYLRAAALDRSLRQAMAANDRAELVLALRGVYAEGGMDFVCLLDPKGTVIYRPRNPLRSGDELADNPLVHQVLQTRQPATGTLILSRQSLMTEGPELAARAHFELVATPAARPTEEKSRSEGMVVAAAVPIFDPQGELLAILYGGDLLNRSSEIVDAIKDDVFREDKDIGTVTIFQGDLRISTNVMRDGKRAVGTRLSKPVAEAVLDGNEERWVGPAFVVNDWYITAYGPIHDPAGQKIGVLYVGLLRAPFAHRQNVLVGWFLAMVLATTVTSLVLISVATRRILHPIERIVAMQQRIVAGDLSARVGIRPGGEMGRLCRAIDDMADAIAEREDQLKQATRRQIGRSEQLASVGRLAAGVAHEINNPLTGVLTFAHLLREKPNLDEQDRQDLDLIIRETTRAAGIVRGLLDFARERPVVKAPCDINAVVQVTVRLLGNQKAFQNIVVVEDLADDLPSVFGDSNQMQQVLLNLSLNACEAMSNGGTLLISTIREDDKVAVKVTDTGCGIKPEHLDQIFEPFFSTKPVGKGTGLGLSVSYGIVQQHGGTLDVESEEGKGTTFTITLPVLADAPAALPGVDAGAKPLNPKL